MCGVYSVSTCLPVASLLPAWGEWPQGSRRDGEGQECLWHTQRLASLLLPHPRHRLYGGMHLTWLGFTDWCSLFRYTVAELDAVFSICYMCMCLCSVRFWASSTSTWTLMLQLTWSPCCSVCSVCMAHGPWINTLPLSSRVCLMFTMFALLFISH